MTLTLTLTLTLRVLGVVAGVALVMLAFKTGSGPALLLGFVAVLGSWTIGR